MPIPNFPGKHDVPSVFDAGELLDALDEDIPEIPPALIICFQDTFFDHVVETYTTGEQLLEAGEDRMYRVTDDVSVVGDFGVGSAITAALVEEKAALGVESFCILGGAGCLDSEIPSDEAILPTHAIRDEGASYHYLAPEQPAKPTPALVETLAEVITDSGIPINEGPTWTIDAFYRETVPEIEQYATEGVLTVEMEAATLFAVADYHNLDAAAVLCIGDYVTPDKRDVPQASESLLPELFDPTVDALQERVSK